MAPSVHNTQPWWFAVDGRELILYADIGRQLLVADPSGREMLISCGAALCTARLAARSLGWIPQTAVLPDPADPLLVARISWQQRAAPVPARRVLAPAAARSKRRPVGTLAPGDGPNGP